MSLSETHGFRQWHGISRAVRGICQAAIDPSSGELDEVKAALEEYRNSGYQLGITALYVLLCPVLLSLGQHEMAMDSIDRGLSIADVNAEKIFESELYRLKAQALRQSGAPAALKEASAALDRALHVARQQQAKSLELRILRDLAQIGASEGKRDEVKKPLASVCEWFKEGDETQDLRQAKALLAEL